MKPMRIGIAGKFVVGLFFLAFLSLLTMGVVVFQGEKANILKTREENLTVLVQLMKQRIESFTRHTLESASMLSRVPRMRAMARLLRDGKASDEIRYEMQSSLMSFLHPDGDMEALFFLHPRTGEVLGSSRAHDEGKFFDKRPYFAAGREGPVVYRVHYSPELEKSILAMAVPVQEGQELLGVLVCWVNVDNMRGTISLNSGIKAFLVNRANLFVLDSAPPRGGLSIQSGVFTEAAENALAGRTGAGVYADAGGVEVVGAYTFIEPLDLALIAEVPLDKVISSADIMGLKVLGLVMVLALAVLGAAVLLGRRMADPLVAISRQAEELASKGAFAHPIEVTGSDEIGVLGKSMNRLAESLALKESEVQQLLGTLDTLIEHIPEGVALLDDRDRVVLANPMAQQYLRDMEGVEVGQRLGSIQHRPLEAFMVSPPEMLWHEVRVKGATPRVFELAVRHISGVEGVQGRVLVMKDVTASREAEDRIQSQERLAAVGHLASGIAHDFNNILTCVIGYSEMMLADDDLPQPLQTSAEAIRNSGRSAAELISQILDFTRRSATEFRTIDLCVLGAEFMKFIERILPGNMLVQFNHGPGRYLVSADHTKMLQVFTNLAVNARDAMPRGGTLSFDLALVSIAPDAVPPVSTLAPGRFVHVRVSDSGEGIAPEALPHIFEPFFTTKTEGKGTGLGLAQVYGIVQQHKGSIDVKSASGSGTEFNIYLPAVDGPAPEEIAAGLEPPAKAGKTPPRRGRTILVVEDDPIVRDLLEKALTHLGYRLLVAHDGEEGVALFKEHSAEVDMVITDVVMPGMNGIELGKRLQQVRPGTKVIGITGYLLEEAERGLGGSGIVELLQKPFRMDELAVVVERALAREKHKEENTES